MNVTSVRLISVTLPIGFKMLQTGDSSRQPRATIYNTSPSKSSSRRHTQATHLKIGLKFSSLNNVFIRVSARIEFSSFFNKFAVFRSFWEEKWPQLRSLKEKDRQNRTKIEGKSSLFHLRTNMCVIRLCGARICCFCSGTHSLNSSRTKTKMADWVLEADASMFLQIRGELGKFWPNHCL